MVMDSFLNYFDTFCESKPKNNGFWGSWTFPLVQKNKNEDIQKFEQNEGDQLLNQNETA